MIEPTCNEYPVPFFACRGYSSQSEQWRAGQRFLKYSEAGQAVLVLHPGDHDPSGVDMTRDNDQRLQLFSEGCRVEVKRIALNMDQVRRYRPPPNPAKFSDSRAACYIVNYGNKSWELDALEPRVIVALLRSHFDDVIDKELQEEAVQREEHARARLKKLASNWREPKA